MKVSKIIESKFMSLGIVAALFAFSSCSSNENAEEDQEVAATTDEEAATPEADTAAAPAIPAPEVAPPPPAPAPMSGGAVLYVKTKKAEVKEQPNATARTVGTLEKGDHVYVQIEGQWAKFGENKYISTSALTEQGVGRTRPKAAWKK